MPTHRLIGSEIGSIFVTNSGPEVATDCSVVASPAVIPVPLAAAQGGAVGSVGSRIQGFPFPFPLPFPLFAFFAFELIGIVLCQH
jgi:hypothetical protein